MRRILPLLWLSALSAEVPYPPLFGAPDVFQKNIAAAEAVTTTLSQRITGITVPHHILAADMIADTLHLASGKNPERIIILSPDHFRRGTTPGSTTTRGFLTALGPVPVDENAARLLAANPCFSESNLFSHEHGVQALLPFIAHWFPGVPVLPVALNTRSSPDDWRRLADAIKPWATQGTLVIQSTDFSHYLPQPVAAEKDRETLRLLATGNPAHIARLHQSNHLDSKAAQWIQMTLQREVFKVNTPLVTDNRNATRYGGRPDEPRTTSYITQLFSPEFIPAAMLPGDAWFFGGDTHFGRHLAKVFSDPARASLIRRKILTVTGSSPLIVNLEGVMLDETPPPQQHPMRIAMKTSATLAELKRLGVTAVSVANNHTLDFGAVRRTRMIRSLSDAGITAVDAEQPVDMGTFRLGAASDLSNSPAPARNLLTAADFEPWRKTNLRKPLFAFLHCGIEYAPAPGSRETQLANQAENAGATLILGCHPHRPSPDWDVSEHSIRFFSMGNLIFDQSAPENQGGLVEIRFFEQGTWFARWIPLGNLYHDTGTR